MKLNPSQQMLLDKIRQSPVEDWTWEFAYEVTGALQELRSKRDYLQMAKSEKRSVNRDKQRAALRTKGYLLSRKLKVGDVVRFRGTRHGGGFRLVMEIEQFDVVCRKLLKGRDGYFHQDDYITRHGKDKLAEIIPGALLADEK